jgi:exonuclease SbcD
MIKHILLSHTAINGSVNNDGSKVECGISVGDFKQWDLVLLGHYHNQQQVGSNIFHIPSIQQNNFGEDNQKGFTVVYSDGSFELFLSKFKQYEKVVIDFDKTSKKQLDTIIKQHSNNDKFVRLDFVGSSDKIKSLNKEELIALGFDVKIKVKEVEQTIEFAEEEVKNHTKESITEEFKLFCKEKNKDFKTGMVYLNKKLNNE